MLTESNQYERKIPAIKKTREKVKTKLQKFIKNFK